MPNIYGAMNTAKMALITHQLSLEVTGQNISNVNNPNFTRQEVQLEAAFPIKPGGSPGLIGTGVRATSVIRHYDNFLEGQRLLNKSTTGYWDSRQDLLNRLEVVYNESSEYGMNHLLNNFFKSFQSLSFNPRGLTERTDTLSQGRNMSTMLNKISGDITNLKIDLDTKIKSSLSEINRITGEIAKMNQSIHEAETFNVHANDFRDKRESLIRDLSEYVEINVIEDSNNQSTVTLKNGRTLVIGQTAFQLSSQGRSDDATASDIFWTDADSNTVNVTSEFANGKMGAWIEMRDTNFTGYKDQLDILAGTIIRDVNNVHSQGYGLDGSTGRNFFSPMRVGTSVGRNNTGTATFAANAIVDPQLVSLHKYEITVQGAGTIDIKDLTTGTTTTGQPYAAGTDIAFFLNKGIQVQLTAGAAVGDTFRVHAGENAAGEIAVDSAMLLDTSRVAAGLTTDQGDGSNALALAQLQDSLNMNKPTPAGSGTATFSEYYNSIVGQVGVAGKTANSMFNQQEAVNFELENRHEQIAGVSLDEEMVNMIKFQHAYQASARMVSVIDQLLQTLIGLGR